MNTMHIEDVDADMLRAWADAGVIPASRYVEEMERRNASSASLKPEGGELAAR